MLFSGELRNGGRKSQRGKQAWKDLGKEGGKRQQGGKSNEHDRPGTQRRGEPAECHHVVFSWG